MRYVASEYTIYKIYRLADPRYSPEDPNYVRYVGKTVERLNERLSTHLCDPEHDSLPWRDWLAGLKDDEKKPEIQLVEIVPSKKGFSTQEHYWVEYHEKIGYNLLNVLLMGGISITDEIGDPIQARKRLAEQVAEVTANAKGRTARIKHARKLRIDFGENTIY